MSFEIDDEIPLKLQDSVKDFVFPCINRSVSKAFFESTSYFFGIGWGMHWAPLKQKLIANIHPEKNMLYSTFFCSIRWTNVSKLQRFIEPSGSTKKPYMKTFIDTFVSKRSEAEPKIEK